MNPINIGNVDKHKMYLAYLGMNNVTSLKSYSHFLAVHLI